MERSVGFRAGYDFQLGSFVVGAQVEYAGVVGAEDSVTSYSTTPASYTFSRNLEDLAAVRARIGYAYGPALIYGTGGFASGQGLQSLLLVEHSEQLHREGAFDQADGYQAGGGVEYMLAPHLSVTGEYIYTSLEPAGLHRPRRSRCRGGEQPVRPDTQYDGH